MWVALNWYLCLWVVAYGNFKSSCRHQQVAMNSHSIEIGNLSDTIFLLQPCQEMMSYPTTQIKTPNSEMLFLGANRPNWLIRVSTPVWFPSFCGAPKDEYLIKLDLTLFAANYNWQRFPDSQRCHLPIKFLLHVSANTFDCSMEVELVRNCKKCEIFFCDPGD